VPGPFFSRFKDRHEARWSETMADHTPFYIPKTFAGKRIKFRVPYSMPAELIVGNAGAGIEFPEASFLHSIELPFEIWNMQLSASQLVNNIPVAAPAPGIDKFWRVRIQDVSKNQLMTKNAQLVATLTDNDAGTWFWRIPYTLVRAEGFLISVDNLLPVAPGNDLRAEITFRGNLLILEPPSETR
jgi:hypothetical protein